MIAVLKAKGYTRVIDLSNEEGNDRCAHWMYSPVISVLELSELY